MRQSASLGYGTKTPSGEALSGQEHLAARSEGKRGLQGLPDIFQREYLPHFGRDDLRNDLRRDLGIGLLDIAHGFGMNPFPKVKIGKGNIGMGRPE